MAGAFSFPSSRRSHIVAENIVKVRIRAELTFPVLNFTLAVAPIIPYLFIYFDSNLAKLKLDHLQPGVV